MKQQEQIKQTPLDWFYKKLILGKFTGEETIKFLYEMAKEMEKEQFGDETYSEIENLIIAWEIDGTKTAGHLTRQIMKLLNK